MARSENKFQTTISQAVELDYMLYLPDDYDESRQWPLLLFLHGAGERGENVTEVEQTGLPQQIKDGLDIPFIVAAPQCKPSMTWYRNYRDALIALVDDLIERYPVDTRRVYLTGLSMGGYGTWDLASTYPERFAAIAPICGGLPHLTDLDYAADQLKNMPAWNFHGALDEAVPVEKSRRIIAALEARGADVTYTEYPDLQHDSWTVTYANRDLYDWFLKYQLAE